VTTFVEVKPDPATAAAYIKAGYFWNSGNFMFRASVLLDEYRRRRRRKRAGGDRRQVSAGPGSDLGFVKLDATHSVPQNRSRSTMRNGKRLCARGPWSPSPAAGPTSASWHAVWELSDKDRPGNCITRAAVSSVPATAMWPPDRGWSRSEGVATSWWSNPGRRTGEQAKGRHGLKRLSRS